MRTVSRTSGSPTATYYPGPRHEWEYCKPEQVGMSSQRVSEAIAFAKANETDIPRDLEKNHFCTYGREPYGEPIGPFKTRGDLTGVVVRYGHIVAEWGEPERVDLGVTKSFLSTTVGLALDRGLIGSLTDRVGTYVPGEYFQSEHNARITWDHLLRQTSDWEGTLWGKPDWADRPPDNLPPQEWAIRERNEPGSTYRYNDVRVNLLALAALQVWRRPLPQVLKEYVMDPIGASNTWRWIGYENSWVTLDGVKMQSVTGGPHWGGGMFISAYDQARFGYFTLRRGKWKDRQLLSDSWFTKALTSTKAQPTYGFMNYFLNTNRESMPSAPERAYRHGGMANVIYVDPENDLVAVLRWIDKKALDGFVKLLIASINEGSGHTASSSIQQQPGGLE